MLPLMEEVEIDALNLAMDTIDKLIGTDVSSDRKQTGEDDVGDSQRNYRWYLS